MNDKELKTVLLSLSIYRDKILDALVCECLGEHLNQLGDEKKVELYKCLTEVDLLYVKLETMHISLAEEE